MPEGFNFSLCFKRLIEKARHDEARFISMIIQSKLHHFLYTVFILYSPFFRRCFCVLSGYTDKSCKKNPAGSGADIEINFG